MLYEYRCYEAVPGRLTDLHRRFQDLTLRVFERHGMEQVGFWVTDVGTNNQLHYILRFQDAADRTAKWKAFQADEEWKQGRAASEANGPLTARIVNQIWSPTPYSAAQ